MSPRALQRRQTMRVSCPTCGAKPGAGCSTGNGWPLSFPHITRVRKALAPMKKTG